MVAEPDDWRRMGQENYLPAGTEWRLKRYRAASETWEHEHCDFCWAKFMDPDFSAAHAAAIEADPTILIEGFTTTESHPRGAEHVWVCPTCFADFAAEFAWVELRP